MRNNSYLVIIGTTMFMLGCVKHIDNISFTSTTTQTSINVTDSSTICGGEHLDNIPLNTDFDMLCKSKEL